MNVFVYEFIVVVLYMVLLWWVNKGVLVMWKWLECKVII